MKETLTQTVPMGAIMTEARQLMNKHGLQNVGLKVIRSCGAFGNCLVSHGSRFFPQEAKPIRIGLSVRLLPYCKPKEITNVILHEIAHALTPGHKHDYVWQRKFIEIGGDGTAKGGEHCYAEGITRQDLLVANSVYKGTCKAGHVHYCNALGRGRVHYCNTCSLGRYDANAIITWVRNPDRKHVRLR